MVAFPSHGGPGQVERSSALHHGPCRVEFWHEHNCMVVRDDRWRVGRTPPPQTPVGRGGI
jgi:hypothetical protein